MTCACLSIYGCRDGGGNGVRTEPVTAVGLDPRNLLVVPKGAGVLS